MDIAEGDNMQSAQHSLVGRGLDQLTSTSTGGVGQLRTTAPNHSNLYVRNLPQEADENLILTLFQPYGSVESVRIFRSSQNPLKSPFAFVKFGGVVEAQTAIANLNGAQLANNVIEVKFADADAGSGNPERTPPPSDNLYVKNLPFNFNENDLRQLFAPYGLVTICRTLHHGDQTGQGGAALVRLSTVEESCRAMQALHGTRPFGGLNNLVVRYADSAEIKAKKHARQAATQGMRYTPYSLGVPGGQQQQQQQQQQPGMKLVNVQGLNPSEYLGQQNLYSNSNPSSLYTDQLFEPSYVATASQNLILSGASHGQGMHGHGAHGAAPKGVAASLYVKNLPLEADRLFLFEKFCPFGAVLSTKIMTDEQGNSKGVGFVNYADPLAAAKAVAALHNLPLGDKNLHVAFQTPRSR